MNYEQTDSNNPWSMKELVKMIEMFYERQTNWFKPSEWFKSSELLKSSERWTNWFKCSMKQSSFIEWLYYDCNENITHSSFWNIKLYENNIFIQLNVSKWKMNEKIKPDQ